MTEARRFFIGTDCSGHEYIVPLERKAEWLRWSNLPEDNEAAWDAPEWAVRLEGGRLTFTDPQVDGQPVGASGERPSK